MRKLLLIWLMGSFALTAIAQSDSTEETDDYYEIDQSATHIMIMGTLTPRTVTTDNDFILSSGWTQVGSKGYGLGISIFTNTGINTYVVGFLHSHMSKRFLFSEVLFGPNIDHDVRGKNAVLDWAGHVYLETKSLGTRIMADEGDTRASGKVIFYCASHGSKKYGRWYGGYVVISPFVKWVSIGIHSERFVSDFAGRLQVNFKRGVTPFLVTDGKIAMFGIRFFK